MNDYERRKERVAAEKRKKKQCRKLRDQDQERRVWGQKERVGKRRGKERKQEG